MRAPDITRYRIEEIEVPPPKDQQQIINEVLGLVEPKPPSGEPRKMLRVTLEGEGFPIMEVPFGISIGNQTLTALEILAGGKQAAGLIEALPNEGDPIAVHTPLVEGGTLIAGHFQMSKLNDTRIA